MPLEKQVVSLELAKKLKSLNVKQESLFYWSQYGKGTIPEDEFEVHYQSVVTEKNGEPVEYFSAYTVSELGEMLPDVIAEGYLYSLQMHRAIAPNQSKHHIAYWFMGDEYLNQEHADTEADARAKMLIYLLENNLITVENLTKKQ